MYFFGLHLLVAGEKASVDDLESLFFSNAKEEGSGTSSKVCSVGSISF